MVDVWLRSSQSSAQLESWPGTCSRFLTSKAGISLQLRVRIALFVYYYLVMVASCLCDPRNGIKVHFWFTSEVLKDALSFATVQIEYLMTVRSEQPPYQWSPPLRPSAERPLSKLATCHCARSSSPRQAVGELRRRVRRAKHPPLWEQTVLMDHHGR